MDHSYLASARVTCPKCRAESEVDVCLIIDAMESPDLISQLSNGTLNQWTCPSCGAVGQVDAPLLVFQRHHNFPLLFSPDPGGDEKENLADAMELVDILKEGLGQRWQTAWEPTVQIVPREELQVVGSDSDELETVGFGQAPWSGKVVLTGLGNGNISLISTGNGGFTLQGGRTGDEVPVREVARKLMDLIGELSDPAEMPWRAELCRMGLNILTDRNSQAWGVFQVALANSLILDPLVSDGSNWEEALDRLMDAARVLTREQYPEDWVDLQSGIGAAYSKRSQGSRSENIEQAISHLQLALDAVDPRSQQDSWANLQNNLGNAYADRVLGSRAENLERAREHYERSLEATSRESSPDLWIQTLTNLGVVYMDRVHGSPPDNLEQALDYLQRAAESAAHERSYAWGEAQFAFGQAFGIRLRGDRADNLERAIEHYQLALQVRTRETAPDGWAMIHQQLGIAFHERLLGNRADNLEQAIEHYQLALQVRTRETAPDAWAALQAELAITFKERPRGNRSTNLEESIRLNQLAIGAITARDFPFEWGAWNSNLGNSFAQRVQGNREDNIERAKEHYQLALETFTREAFPERWAMLQMHIGITYAERNRGERSENFSRAIEYFQRGLEVYTRESYPAYHQRVLALLGRVYFEQRDWFEASRSYGQAIDVGLDLLSASFTEPGRDTLIATTPWMYSHAAFSLLKQGDFGGAIVRLEQGRARGLAEAIALHDADLSALSEVNRNRVLQARTALREVQTEIQSSAQPRRRSDAELGQLLREQWARLRESIDAARAERPEFMPTGLSLEGILDLVPERGALVAPLVTPQGGAVVVLTSGLDEISNDHVVALDELNERAIGDWLDPAESDAGWIRQLFDSRYPDGLKAWIAALERYTETFWSALMEKIHNRLLLLGLQPGATVLFMLPGWLGLLPLHAARRKVGGGHRTFLDDWVVSYVPSAYALSVGRRRLQDARRYGGQTLIVVDPTSDLDFARVEGDAIAELGGAQPIQKLEGADASRDEVIQSISGSSFVHFACHGFYDWNDMTRSSLVLAEDERLSLEEVISSRVDLSGARLVTLSACETGLAEYVSVPDEFVGLQAGFLEAGAPAVISSLWAVNDMSTALLMRELYRRLMVEEQPVAAALRGAQLWLSTSTAERLELASHWRRIYEGSSRTDQHAFDAMRYYRANPGDVPFVSPYFWAGFTVAGAAHEDYSLKPFV
jgi:tetratricopeptide (TPR) repeat protein